MSEKFIRIKKTQIFKFTGTNTELCKEYISNTWLTLQQQTCKLVFLLIISKIFEFWGLVLFLSIRFTPESNLKKKQCEKNVAKFSNWENKTKKGL